MYQYSTASFLGDHIIIHVVLIWIATIMYNSVLTVNDNPPPPFSPS